MKAEAVFFDLDETLLDYDDAAYALTISHVAGEIGTLARLDSSQLAQTYQRINETLWRERAFLTRMFSASDGLGIWRETWLEAIRECGCYESELAQRALELYVAHREASYKLFEDAEALLLELKRLGLPLALLTNGASDTQRHKVDVMQLERHFDAVIISGEVGAAKPDAAVFRFALDRLGVRPEQAWHIGDNIRSDVGGARDAGLTAVWLNRNRVVRRDDEPVPHHEIASLVELKSLLAAET